MSVRHLKVSEVNNYIKRVFQTDMILSNISIEGEISNFKHHYSGHMYFNLKDEKGKIKCVMFKSDNEKLIFNPKEGMKIIATGYISLYEREGEYQFYIRHMKESGVGDLYREFEDLKKKLKDEGIFDESHKKAIPFIPKTIGVVTSATGAAIRDIINVIRRRYPPCNIVVYPSLVQGQDAPKEICRGLEYLDNRDDIDLIIVGRGGGSIEELFSFNSEELARLIFDMETPVISAVGHETDFTITDFVADLRAPTPSAAAELCVPDIHHLTSNINDIYDKLYTSINSFISKHYREIAYLRKNIDYFNPLTSLRQREQDLDSIFKDLNYAIENKISRQKNELNIIKSNIDFLNPLLAIKKGYGLLTDKDDKSIHSIKDININDEIYINLIDGKIEAMVSGLKEVKGDEWNRINLWRGCRKFKVYIGKTGKWWFDSWGFYEEFQRRNKTI